MSYNYKITEYRAPFLTANLKGRYFSFGNLLSVLYCFASHHPLHPPPSLIPQASPPFPLQTFSLRTTPTSPPPLCLQVSPRSPCRPHGVRSGRCSRSSGSPCNSSSSRPICHASAAAFRGDKGLATAEAVTTFRVPPSASTVFITCQSFRSQRGVIASTHHAAATMP